MEKALFLDTLLDVTDSISHTRSPRGDEGELKREIASLIRKRRINGDTMIYDNDVVLAVCHFIGRVNHPLDLKALVLLERAWEYYQKHTKAEPKEPVVVGRFGPGGNMQGPDHPFRK